MDADPPGFSLIETMRHEPATGFLRLDLHLARLSASAEALGFAGAGAARDALVALEKTASPMRVRLELFASGRIEITTAPFHPVEDGTVWRLKIARTRLSSRDPLLCHKTSRRGVYDAARAEFDRGEADEVLLLNEKGAVCEGTITTLFVDDGAGGLVTPPLSAGLLAGVLRAELLCRKKARVAPIFPRDLAGKSLYLGNSLRGLIPARLA
jgi:4-amino-4-deoxychorismate lyase